MFDRQTHKSNQFKTPETMLRLFFAHSKFNFAEYFIKNYKKLVNRV